MHFFNFSLNHLRLLIGLSLSNKCEETCFFIIQAFIDHILYQSKVELLLINKMVKLGGAILTEILNFWICWPPQMGSTHDAYAIVHI